MALPGDVVAGVKASWPAVAADAEGFGVAWFTSAFKKDASIKALFGGKAADSAQMKGHLGKITGKIGEAVGSIDNPAAMTAGLNAINNGHSGMGIAKAAQSKAMLDALVETVKARYGAQHGPAWQAFGKRIIADALVNA